MTVAVHPGLHARDRSPGSAVGSVPGHPPEPLDHNWTIAVVDHTGGQGE